jgi:hypothetical protein
MFNIIMSHMNQYPGPDADTIAKALAKVPRNIYALTESEGYQEMCARRGIDPIDERPGQAHRPRLAALSDYGRIAVREAIARGDDPLQVKVLELSASAPLAIYDSAALNALGDRHPEKFNAKADVSEFNAKLRDLAKEFPAAPAAAVRKALLNAANITINHPGALKNAANATGSAIVGAQHEYGFGQTVEHTGRSHTPAPLKYDLAGVDEIVDSTLYPDRPLYVDVKASTTGVGNGGKPFAIRDNLFIHSGSDVIESKGVVMQSGLHDEDFSGHMALPQALAASKAPALDTLLTQAEYEMYMNRGQR